MPKQKRIRVRMADEVYYQQLKIKTVTMLYPCRSFAS